MKKKGFTLIELLVVIVLIGVISLITVPIVSNIIENSKKEAFKRSIEGLGREYEYKEVQTNTTLGEIDTCSLQETCKIEGTIKRDSLGNVSVYVTNGNYCTNGIIGSLIVVNGTCGVGTGIDEITFAVTNHEISYSKDTQVIDITPIGGSGDFTYTKVSEKNSSNVDTNYITVNDGILQVSPSIVKGNYTVRVRIKDNETKVEKEVNIVITIDEVSISNIELADIASIDYDGTAQKPNIVVVSNGSILEENIDYEVIYENNINAGEATVIIRGIGNYTGEITKTFTINRVEAPNTSVVAASLDYNGLNQSLISSVNVSNSHVYYSVDTPINSSNYLSIGSETKPTRSEAGTYVVYYYAPADNYNEVSGSVTVTINPIVINIPPQPNDKNYTGSSQNSGITCPTGSSASGTQSAINAGSYTQICTLNNSNYKWNDNTITPKDITWVINRLNTAEKGSCNTLTYNGSSQTLVSGGNHVSYVNNSGTIADDYTVTINAIDNYAFSDGSISSSLTCTINPQVLNIPTSPSDKNYTGSTQDSGITCPNGSNASGDISATYPGTYTQTCTLSNTTNYKWNDNSTTPKDITWVIKGVAEVGTCNSLTYNGSSQTLVSGGEHVTYVNNSGTNAGDYTVTANAEEGFKFIDGSTSKTISCTIDRISVAIPSSTSTTYNGSTQNSGITCPSVSTTSGTQSAINAGTYIQTCTLNNGNYKWSNNTTGARDIYWYIYSATPEMEVPTTTTQLNVGTTGTITVTGSNYGTVTCSSSSTSIATCSVSGNTITINAVSEGNASLTIRGSGATNYSSISKTHYVKVNAPMVYMYSTSSIYYGGSYSPSTLDSSQYKTNYRDVVNSSGKKYFLGFKLNSSNKVTKAYACAALDFGGSKERIICVQGNTTTGYFYSNKSLIDEAYNRDKYAVSYCSLSYGYTSQTWYTGSASCDPTTDIFTNSGQVRVIWSGGNCYVYDTGYAKCG